MTKSIDLSTPDSTPVGLQPEGFAQLADKLAHSAIATAIVASGLKRQIECGELSTPQALASLDAIIDESIAAHRLAAEVFSDGGRRDRH